jgi:DENN domain-containing protein 5
MYKKNFIIIESLTNLNIIPPLDRSYKSKTLANYPQNVSWNPFDSYGVCLLSLPQGLKFRTQKHDLSPRFHSFASTRDDGKRCYGFSLVFYEEIKNENISTAMQTLQSMYLTELSSSQGSLRRQENNTNRSLPRHFRINEDEKSSLSLFDIQKDTLYVSKSISLICQLPYNHIAEVFLTNLYKCLPRSPGARLSLESYVYNMLYDVKIPEYGKSIRIHLPPEQPSMMPINIILQRPKSTELPLLDYPLRLLFECLGVECVTELFTCVLLENQVLLISEDFQKLTIIAECITSLLFPFEWCHVYAPILPTALHHFLDAPCPFIMGLHSENLDENLQQRAGLCYVDIDNKKIRLPDELPIFPHKSDFISDIYEILQKFDVVDVESASQVQETSSTTSDYESILNPKSLMSNFYFSSPSNEKYGNVGYSRLSSNLSTSLSLSKSRRKKHSLHDFINNFDLSESSGSNSCLQEFSPHTPRSKTFDTRVISNELYYKDLRINAEIREMFLNRFCQIFLDYEQFVILPNQNKIEWIKNRESLHNFDKASFLSDQTTQYRSFLSQFLESQMFATLIDNKILASFDEKLAGSSKSATLSIDEQKKTDENPVSKNLLSFDHRIKILK